MAAQAPDPSVAVPSKDVGQLRAGRLVSLDAFRGATIAGMIVNLGRMLGLAVIAEGVETVQQFDALREMGCQEVQGFYFSPPVPAGEFAALLRKR